MRHTGTFVDAGHSYDQKMPAGELDFDTVVELHQASLYVFAMSLTRNEADACDLVQETFVKWAEKGAQLRDRSKLKSWLFTTLHRRFLESQRRIIRFPHLELSSAELELPTIEPRAAERLDAMRVVEALGRVDAQFRSAVALFYLEDYSYNEIAEVLEVPLGTVKSRISRGIQQLKQLLATEGSTQEEGR